MAKLNGITKWLRNGAVWDARLVLTEMALLWDQNDTDLNGIQMSKLNVICMSNICKQKWHTNGTHRGTHKWFSLMAWQ